MKGLSPRLRARLVEHFELFLTIVGVLMAMLVALSELSRNQQGMAVIFLIWLQGFILWAVHRHCWFRRRALVHKMRAMLQDRVNNQLTVLISVAELCTDDASEKGREDLERAIRAARAVSLELHNLSFESLRTWEQRYGRSLPYPPS